MCDLVWKNARNFQNLQNAMILFLQHKCEKNPWHLGSVDLETNPILHNLIKINQKGFVTIQGQPGVITQTMKQRGFLEGFMLNTKVDSFINKLKKYDIIIYKERLDAVSLINLGDRYKTIDEISPGKFGINLTLGLDNNEYYTNFSKYESVGQHEISFLSDNSKLYRYMLQNCTFITLINRKYGDPDLEDLVLKCL